MSSEEQQGGAGSDTEKPGEHQAAEMEQRSKELEKRIDEADSEWKAKLDDGGVPGAQLSEEELAARADAGSHGPATGAADVEDERS